MHKAADTPSAKRARDAENPAAPVLFEGATDAQLVAELARRRSKKPKTTEEETEIKTTEEETEIKTEPTEPKTEPAEPDLVIVLVDQSGSMQAFPGGWDEVRSEVKKSIKKIPEERGEGALVSFWTFNSDLSKHATGVPAADFKATDAMMQPEGMTAWRDAVMSAIEDALAHPGNTRIVVFTDGEDNRSTTMPAALKVKMEEAKKSRGVDFTFLGAEDAKLEEAAEAGIDVARHAMRVGKRAKHVGYSLRAAFGKQVSVGLTPEDRATAFESEDDEE